MEEIQPQPPTAPAAPASPVVPSITRTADLFAAPADPATADDQGALPDPGFEGPKSIAAYTFGLPPHGVEQSPEQEIEMRTLFHEEGIPAGLGSEIGRRYNAALANPPTDTDLYFSRQTAALALQKVWGADMEKNLEIAKGEVRRMAAKQPKIYQMLEYSGLGNDPWLCQTLYNIARGKGRVK